MSWKDEKRVEYSNGKRLDSLLTVCISIMALSEYTNIRESLQIENKNVESLKKLNYKTKNNIQMKCQIEFCI